MNFRWNICFFLLGVIIHLGCRKLYDPLEYQTVVLPEQGRVNKIKFKNELEGYALGGARWSDGFLYRTLDGGIIWDPVQAVNEVADFHLTDIAFLSDDKIVLVGFGGLIFYTSDGGNSWEYNRNLNWEQFETVHKLDEDQFILGGGGDFYGGVMGQNAVGEWWNIQMDSLPIKAFDMHLSNPENLLIAGYSGVFSRSLKTQTEGPYTLTGDFFTGISFPTDSVGFVCGFDGSVWKINMLGEPMRQLIPNAPLLSKSYGWFGIHFFSEKKGVVVGLDKQLRYTGNGGESWGTFQLSGTQALYTIEGVSNQQVWVGGDKGFLAKVILP